ncbi:hypothetical protein [Brucella intermedia]|uniref:hypothetical protein n=1 Tax=Brucella intermedia TaxID=94625 RepID=UPI001590E72C|nr:hypothetical protein [Brucella intermedia]
MSAQSGAVNLSMSTEFMFLFCSKRNLRHEKDMRSPQIFMGFCTVSRAENAVLHISGAKTASALI